MKVKVVASKDVVGEVETVDDGGDIEEEGGKKVVVAFNIF